MTKSHHPLSAAPPQNRTRVWIFLLSITLVALFVVAAFSGRSYIDATVQIATQRSSTAKRNVQIKKEFAPIVQEIARRTPAPPEWEMELNNLHNNNPSPQQQLKEKETEDAGRGTKMPVPTATTRRALREHAPVCRDASSSWGTQQKIKKGDTPTTASAAPPSATTFQLLVDCSRKLGSGYFWRWDRKECVMLAGWNPTLLGYEVSPDELTCVPESNFSIRRIRSRASAAAQKNSTNSSSSSSQTTNDANAVPSWLKFPFSNATQDSSSPASKKNLQVRLKSPHDVVKLFVEPNVPDAFVTPDISSDDVTLLLQHYSNFMYFSSFMFRQWKPWRPSFKLIDDHRPRNDENQNPPQLPAPHFSSRHDEKFENLFRVDHFCISPFHGLSGFDPHKKDSYRSKDDTRNVYHGLEMFQKFFEDVTSLATRPLIFDTRPVLFVPITDHNRHNLAHVLHQVMGVVGIMGFKKRTLFGGSSSSASSASASSFFSEADRNQQSLNAAAGGNNNNNNNNDEQVRQRMIAAAHRSNFDFTQSKVQPLLVFVNLLDDPTSAETVAEDSQEETHPSSKKKKKALPRDFYENKLITQRSAAWGFFFRMLDLPVASILFADKKNGQLLSPELVSSLFKLTGHRYDPFSKKQDGSSNNARVCFERGVAYHNCFHCTDQPESERESVSFGNWVQLSSKRQAVVDTFRRLTATCLGPFPRHTSPHPLPRLFIDVRSKFRGIADFGIFFDKIRSELTEGGHRWVEDVVAVREPWIGSRGKYMEQVRSSDIFIAPHGAALSSVIFLKKGSVVVEVSSPNHFCRPSLLSATSGRGGGGGSSVQSDNNNNNNRQRRSSSAASSSPWDEKQQQQRQKKNILPPNWWSKSCWFGTFTKAASLDHWIVTPAVTPVKDFSISSGAQKQSSSASSSTTKTTTTSSSSSPTSKTAVHNRDEDFVIPWTSLIDVLRAASCRWQGQTHNVDNGGCAAYHKLEQTTRGGARALKNRVIDLNIQGDHLGRTEFVSSLFSLFGAAAAGSSHVVMLDDEARSDFVKSQATSMLWLLSNEFTSASSLFKLESCSAGEWRKILFHLLGRDVEITRRRSAALTDSSFAEQERLVATKVRVVACLDAEEYKLATATPVDTSSTTTTATSFGNVEVPASDSAAAPGRVFYATCLYAVVWA